MCFCYIVAGKIDKKNSFAVKEVLFIKSNNEEEKRNYYLVLIERFIS